MCNDFIYEAASHRVLFGSGTTARLTEELSLLGLSRPILVSSARQGRRAAGHLSEVFFAGLLAEAVMHTPTDVTEKGLRFLKDAEADSIVSFGGGSATGLGKALALRSDLPLLAIATTYGGSEMTSLLGETENGVKSTRRDSRVLPKVTFYDADLTFGLPPQTSAASGLNALAHAVEGVYAPDANPIVTAIALSAISVLMRSLPVVAANPFDLSGRSLAMSGACQAGLVLNAVQMGLHHKLCHTMGGMFNLPHAEMHAVLLPYVMAYNMPAVPVQFEAMAKAMEATNAVTAVSELARKILAFNSLKDLGMPQDGIGRAVESILANPYRNPRPLEPNGIRELLERAWAGQPSM